MAGGVTKAVRIAGLCGLALIVSGCGIRERLGFGGPASVDPLPYEAQLVAGAERNFTVSVAAGAAGVDDVRESVRFPATVHCLQSFGASDAEWDRDATGEWQMARSETGALVFQGRCTAR